MSDTDTKHKEACEELKKVFKNCVDIVYGQSEIHIKYDQAEAACYALNSDMYACEGREKPNLDYFSLY